MDAIDGLLGLCEPSRLGVDGAIIRALAKPATPWLGAGTGDADRVRLGDSQTLAVFEDCLGRLAASSRREMTIPAPGRSLLERLRLVGYPDFGLFVARSPRLYAAIRCGPVGQLGRGGHDHNDQLSLELSVDGMDLISDPGTYLYTPLPERRNAYRSVRAHFAPQLVGPEPASLDDGLFQLGRGSQATCLYWGEHGFAGELRTADGRIALCRVRFAEDAIHIVHGAVGADLIPAPPDAADWRAMLPDIPFSRGYGILDH